MAKLCVWLVFLFACSAFGQVKAISGQIVNQNGVPLPNALVRVCDATLSTGTPCDPVAPIYLDYGLTQPAPNPYQADQYGNYTLYAPALPAPNLYDVQFSPNSGITWSYVVNGPTNGAPEIQACNQPGLTAAQQINAAFSMIPNGGVIDATCYGAGTQIVDQQITALSHPTSPVELKLNQVTNWSITAAFSSALISSNVTTGVSGTAGACMVPIANGSSIYTPGWNQPATPHGYWRLAPNAATYDVFCNAVQDGTQESISINGLGIIGDPGATMSGSLLHTRLIFVSTLIENVVTYLPYGNAVTVDSGSDNFFINDNFNDSSHTGGYLGTVLTLHCVGGFTMTGGAVQFNGQNNALLVVDGYNPKIPSCPLGASSRGVRFYNVDLETDAATVGTFPGAPTNVDPIQITDSGFVLIDNMIVYGNLGAGQQHLVDIMSTGDNGQLRGPIEINNIQGFLGFTGPLIHNTNAPKYVAPALRDVYGTQNDAALVIGQYKWEGSGASQASSIDYEDYKDFTSVQTGFLNGDVNAARQDGSDIGAKVNASIPLCNAQCEVHIPAGTYHFTTPIVLPMTNFGALSLVLDDGAKLFYDGTSGCAINAGVTTGPLISNLRIRGGQLYGNASAQCGVHINPTNSVTVSGMLINGFASGRGIWVEGANGVNINDNRIFSNQVGIYATNTYCTGNFCSPTNTSGASFTPNAIGIHHNVITANSNWGIQFFEPSTAFASGPLNNIIDSNDLELNGGAGSAFGAISVGRSTNMVIGPGNYFEGSPRQVVLGFPGSPGVFFASIAPVVRDNFFNMLNGTQYYIEAQDTNGLLVEGNGTIPTSLNAATTNCFLNETEAISTVYGKNTVFTGASGSPGATLNPVCQAGTPENSPSGAGSYSQINQNYFPRLTYQNFAITAAASDTQAAQFVLPSDSCYATAAGTSPTLTGNAQAIIAQVYVIPGTAQFTIYHPTGDASLQFNIWCSGVPN